MSCYEHPIQNVPTPMPTSTIRPLPMLEMILSFTNMRAALFNELRLLLEELNIVPVTDALATLWITARILTECNEKSGLRQEAKAENRGHTSIIGVVVDRNRTLVRS